MRRRKVERLLNNVRNSKVMIMKKWMFPFLSSVVCVCVGCLVAQLKGGDKGVQSVSLTVAVPQEKVVGTILDEDKKPLVAEVRFFDSEGGLVKRTQTDLEGKYEMLLDEGYYTVEVSKGYEYECQVVSIEVKQGQPVQVEPIALSRLIDWGAKDYYCGDFNQRSHFSPDGQNTIEEILTANLASGLNYGALVDENTVDGSEEWKSLADKVNFLAISGQTFTHHQASYIALNTSDLVVMEESSPLESLEEVGHQIHESGGLLMTDALNDSLSQLLTQGVIDAVEIWNGQLVPPLSHLEEVDKEFRLNETRKEKWFELLSQGLKLPALANSNNRNINGDAITATMTKNDRFNQWLVDGTTIGSPRNYIKLEELTPEGVVKGIKDGHIFMTNGPLMDITLNDKTFGDEVSGVTDAEITYLITSSQSELMSLNIIGDGKVIQTIPLAKNVPNLGTITLNLSDCHWVVFEVLTTSYEYALSNPIYLKAE